MGQSVALPPHSSRVPGSVVSCGYFLCGVSVPALPVSMWTSTINCLHVWTCVRALRFWERLRNYHDHYHDEVLTEWMMDEWRGMNGQDAWSDWVPLYRSPPPMVTSSAAIHEGCVVRSQVVQPGQLSAPCLARPVWIRTVWKCRPNTGHLQTSAADTYTNKTLRK